MTAKRALVRPPCCDSRVKPPRTGQTRAMWTGSIEFDLLLGDVRSLKQKRSVVRPIVAEVTRRFAVSVAEVGHLEKHRRAGVGVAVVAGDQAHVIAVLNSIESLVSTFPEVELLSSHRAIRHTDDD